MPNPITPAVTLRARRRSLHVLLAGPALLCAGLPVSRNFRANHYPFRANSHFLYFVGRSIEGAAVLFAGGKTTLFTHPPDPQDALWHGPRPELDSLRRELDFDAVLPLAELDPTLRAIGGAVATLPSEDAHSAAWLSERLGRSVVASSGDALGPPDDALADAMIALRSSHDDAAVAQLRRAANVSAEAHVAGMRATRAGGSEHEVVAAMLGVLRREGLDDAYGPIVTVAGEVLHSRGHDNETRAGDLLLADVGGETPEGWSADITRTWPVSGRYSPTQRAIYDVVLEAQARAIAVARPGARYRDVHEAAKRAIVEGLRALGIFKGDVDGLLERGAAALFFPHGIGHLLGLDVHDMEDLGDRAGYAPGRARSARFGDAFLRLDRDLAAGMLVTIEPGFYQVPQILGDATYTAAVGADLDRDVLAQYGDVRGIRIEDDVLITASGNEILSAAVPKDAAAIEALMASRKGIAR
jgi:Xaa-Pro aminopeptidase